MAQAAQAATAAGTLGGGLAELVKSQLAPRADWRELLREFMSKVSKDDYSWSRPSRRFISQGLYLPSAHSESVGEVWIFVDTSASISSTMLAAFSEEINAILDELKPEAVHVVMADTRVKDHIVYEPDDYPVEFEAKGRGGTLFQPSFDWAKANLDGEPDCALYLTDMEPGDGDRVQDPGYPLLWCDFSGSTALGYSYGWQPTFGEHVIIE